VGYNAPSEISPDWLKDEFDGPLPEEAFTNETTEEEIENELKRVDSLLSLFRTNKHVVEALFRGIAFKVKHHEKMLCSIHNAIEPVKYSQGYIAGISEVYNVIPLLEAEKTRLEGELKRLTSESLA